MTGPADSRPPFRRYRGKIGAQLRQDEALRLWVSGMTYIQIAEELGYASHAGAHNAVTSALTRHNALTEELAEHGRQIALARLRPLWVKAFDNATSATGSSKDVLAALQVADRLGRLEGVKDPTTEIRLTVETQLDHDIAKLTEALSRNGVPVAQVLDAAGQ